MSSSPKRIRRRKGEETKKCLHCEEEQDIIKFRIYWYQPTKRGKPIGEKERRRLDKCNKCRGKE